MYSSTLFNREWDARPPRKKNRKWRRLDPVTSADRAGEQPIFQPLVPTDKALESDELWADQSFFAIGLPSIGFDPPIDFNFLDEDPEPDLARETWELDIASLSDSLSNDTQFDVLTNVLFPDLPDVADRQVNVNLLNPFIEGAVGRYDNPRATVATTKEGEVNGYVKFRLQQTQAGFDEPTGTLGRKVVGLHPRQCSTKLPEAVVPLLPRDFGRKLKLDKNDQKLLTFYLTAYCQGRTLIPKSNFWLTEIPPMADSDPIVQEALLAISGSYVLDYVQSEELRQRTSRHYTRASELISQAVSLPESHAVGKSDALVTAVILLEKEDAVFWELRRPKTKIPNFYRGNLLAKSILDHSDPGFRYWKSANVQYTKSWAGISASVAVGCILPEMMSPLLPPVPCNRNYSWLLGGTKKEAHTIYGSKGQSPKLIHTFAQITRLCEEIKESPESVIIPIAATKIVELLENFRQRSELSEGYATTAALLDSCELDENGKVNTAIKVTELTGEAWLCAAKIYLHCRFFRRPPSHPNVRTTLNSLMCCITRLPQKGPLLTAQSPFFPVFLMAILSSTPEDRAVAREWFETVVSGGGRSNVPPVWQAVQLLWTWLDENVNSQGYVLASENTPFGLTRAWWEEMVEYIAGEIGWMSLT